MTLTFWNSIGSANRPMAREPDWRPADAAGQAVTSAARFCNRALMLSTSARGVAANSVLV